eukprot:m.263302 g.263302  ORF g.263302 m.263302 type:complete len:314 (-) comp11051_c2_seq14:73-1014(-)
MADRQRRCVLGQQCNVHQLAQQLCHERRSLSAHSSIADIRAVANQQHCSCVNQHVDACGRLDLLDDFVGDAVRHDGLEPLVAAQLALQEDQIASSLMARHCCDKLGQLGVERRGVGRAVLVEDAADLNDALKGALQQGLDVVADFLQEGHSLVLLHLVCVGKNQSRLGAAALGGQHPEPVQRLHLARARLLKLLQRVDNDKVHAARLADERSMHVVVEVLPSTVLDDNRCARELELVLDHANAHLRGDAMEEPPEERLGAALDAVAESRLADPAIAEQQPRRFGSRLRTLLEACQCAAAVHQRLACSAGWRAQ